MSAQPVMTDAFRDAWDWSFEHTGELYDRYEDQWVAISGGGVVAAGRNPRRVEADALRNTGRPREDFLIQYVESRFAIYGQGFAEIQD